jgi:regulatory protein
VSKDKSEPLEKAKNYAFLLLKFRQRSAKEITQRLKQKNFDDSVIKETLSFLKRQGFVDDESFAKAWIDSRLKKPLGLRRIKEELRIKGIDTDIIESNLKKIKQDYLEEEVVARIAADRLSKLKGIEPQKAKRRTFAYLLRRGFSPEVILDTLARI